MIEQLAGHCPPGPHAVLSGRGGPGPPRRRARRDPPAVVGDRSKARLAPASTVTTGCSVAVSKAEQPSCLKERERGPQTASSESGGYAESLSMPASFENWSAEVAIHTAWPRLSTQSCSTRQFTGRALPGQCRRTRKVISGRRTGHQRATVSAVARNTRAAIEIAASVQNCSGKFRISVSSTRSGQGPRRISTYVPAQRSRHRQASLFSARPTRMAPTMIASRPTGPLPGQSP